jgi:hypothetical protein
MGCSSTSLTSRSTTSRKSNVCTIGMGKMLILFIYLFSFLSFFLSFFLCLFLNLCCFDCVVIHAKVRLSEIQSAWPVRTRVFRTNLSCSRSSPPACCLWPSSTHRAFVVYFHSLCALWILVSYFR